MGLVGLVLVVLVSYVAKELVELFLHPRLRALARSRPVIARIASSLLLAGFIVLALFIVHLTLRPSLREGFEAPAGYVWSDTGLPYSRGHLGAVLLMYFCVVFFPIDQLRFVSEILSHTIRPKKWSLSVAITIGVIVTIVYYWLFSDVLAIISMILSKTRGISVRAFWFCKGGTTCFFALLIFFRGIFGVRAKAEP